MKSRYIDLRRLQTVEGADLAMLFLVAGNDIQAITYCALLLTKKKENDRLLIDFIKGAKFYCIRLLCAHVREGLRLIEEAKTNIFILQLIGRNQRALDAFKHLQKYCKAGEMAKEFTLIDDIRNKGTFHYYDWVDKNMGPWFKESIDLLVKHGSRISAITDFEDTDRPWRHVIADDVFDVAFAGKVLNIPLEAEEEDRQAKLREVVDVLDVLISNFAYVTQGIAQGLLNNYAY